MAKKVATESVEATTSNPVTFGGSLAARPEWDDESTDSEETTESVEAKASDTAPASETETKVESEVAKEETTQGETVEGQEAAPAAVATKEAATDATQAQGQQTVETKTVPLDAMLGERRKFQSRIEALEAKVRQYEGDPSQTSYTDPNVGISAPAVKEIESKFQNKLTTISINAARRVHKDFDEKYAAVAQASQTDPRVLDWIDSSEDPGEACYQYGEEIVYQQKYGRTRQEQHTNLEKELTEKLSKKIRADVEAEFLTKLQKKKNNPTQISNARAAGGNGSAEYRGASFGQRLSR